jgi:hypothetical protein
MALLTKGREQIDLSDLRGLPEKNPPTFHPETDIAV